LKATVVVLEAAYNGCWEGTAAEPGMRAGRRSGLAGGD
jgi:hypothetical protein